MKIRKMIAVLAISAFVAGGAFAQITVGGGAIMGVNIATSDDDDDSEVYAGGSIGLVRLTAVGSVDTVIGEFGLWIRAQRTWMGIDPAWSGNNWNAYTWWRPNDFFRIDLGANPDGHLNMDGIARFGFYQMANDTFASGGFGVARNYYIGNASFSQPFFEGTTYGLRLQLSPLDMLDINVALPFSWDGSQDPWSRNAGEIGDVFGAMLLQADVNLDFGRIGLTYLLNNDDDHSGNLWAYLGLTSVNNLHLDFGIGADLDYDAAISVGLAARYSFNPEFMLTARTVALIDTHDDAEFELMFEILPSYLLAPGITAFLGAGVAFTGGDDSVLSWHINPYVRFGSTWGPSFYAGFEIRRWAAKMPRWNGEFRLACTCSSKLTLR